MSETRRVSRCHTKSGTKTTNNSRSEPNWELVLDFVRPELYRRSDRLRVPVDVRIVILVEHNLQTLSV